MLKLNFKIFFQSFCIFLLVHIPIIIVSNYVFLNRAIFNLDYIFGLLLAPFNIYFSFFLLFITFLLDILISGYFLFDFIDLNDLFYSLSFLKDVEFFSIINFTIFILIILFCLIFFFALKYTNKNKLKYFILIVLILFLIDFTNSTNKFSLNSIVRLNINISGSNFSNIAHYIIKKNKLKIKEEIKIQKFDKSIINIHEEIKRLESNEEFSLILIILESFGKSNNQFINNELEKIFLSNINEIDFKISSAQRFGHTQQGELQILCNILISNTQNLKNIDFTKYNCFPNELKKRKIFTVAYHGFSSNFFDRKNWWNKIGFEKTFFFDDLKFLKNKCGSYLVGKCDKDMIKEVFKQASKKKGFYYLLTLNTHYPYKPKKIDKNFLQKCEKKKIENAVCLITQIYKENLISIMEELKKTDKKIKVIITGDHKPPFLKKEEQIYFPENKVINIEIEKNEKKN